MISAFSDSRIVRLLNTHNIGYAENMNALFKAAKGEYIVIQDADDYSTENRLEILVDFLSKNEDIDMVGSSCIKVEEDKEQKVTMPLGADFIAQSFEAMTNPLPVLNGTLMFKREIIDKGFFFRKLKYVNRGQDDDWLFRVSEYFKITNVKEYLYYYRVNASSMTQNPKHYTYYSIFAGEYVRFLKHYRMTHGVDLLEQNNWSIIDAFFQKEKTSVTSIQPAYLELYIAHKYLALNNRFRSLSWLFKALFKDMGNAFIWKKIIYIVWNKK